MNKKRKIQIVVIVPVVVVVIVACASIYFVLQAGIAGGKNMVSASEISLKPRLPEDGVVQSAAAEGGVDNFKGLDPVRPECNFSDWVGGAVDEAAVKATGRPYRILGPNSMATMDFSPDRINVIVDDGGMVVEVRCG